MPTLFAVFAGLRSLRCRVARRRDFRAGDERGQGMLEYAMIGGIIIIGAVAALVTLSGALNRLFSQIADTLAQF